MRAPSMETVTASLERSLRNCSISSASPPPLDQQISPADADDDAKALDLNFQPPLPCQWDQCIDFKTGEIYYINRSNGKKSKEDPRKVTVRLNTTEEENNSNKSDGSSSPPPPPPPTAPSTDDFNYEEQVLVVAGCKSCLMYFMLPKKADQCPKCSNSLLLHFHQPENECP